MANLNPLSIAAKTVGALGAAIVLLDANAMGIRKADEQSKVGIANQALNQHIGMSKMDYPSPLYNELRENAKASFPHTFTSTVYGIGGYFKGLYQGVSNKLPLLATSAVAVFAKNKTIQKIGMAGVGLTALWGYIKNTTTLFEHKKYLD